MYKMSKKDSKARAKKAWVTRNANKAKRAQVLVPVEVVAPVVEKAAPVIMKHIPLSEQHRHISFITAHSRTGQEYKFIKVDQEVMEYEEQKISA